VEAAVADDHLWERTLESSTVFHGRLLHVKSDRVRLPNGSESAREYILHPGAVVVIAVLDNGKLLFERQFRYPLQRVMLEMPAGKIDAGEPEIECGRRELREETGYEAARWRHLGTLHPCVGYSDERIEIYLAQELNHVGHARDHEEFIETVELSLEEAIAAVRDGRITDGKTVASVFWAQQLLR
jgi:ADP-ribose pyrophosphatase